MKQSSTPTKTPPAAQPEPDTKPRNFANRDDIFIYLLGCCATGVASQFEQPYQDSFDSMQHHYDGGKEETKRSGHLARRACNMAHDLMEELDTDYLNETLINNANPAGN